MASLATAVDKPPEVLRSYDCGGLDAAKCSIWEAARATTALPLFFKPIRIAHGHQCEWFVGGGLACNNPAEVAVDEAHALWPTITSCYLISIGTGNQGPVQVIDAGDLTRKALWTRKVPGADKIRNRHLGLAALKRVREAHVRLSDNSADTHRRMMKWSQLPGNIYYRFNVEEGLEGIGLVEWKSMKEIVARTVRYLQGRDVEKILKICAAEITM